MQIRKYVNSSVLQYHEVLTVAKNLHTFDSQYKSLGTYSTSDALIHEC